MERGAAGDGWDLGPEPALFCFVHDNLQVHRDSLGASNVLRQKYTATTRLKSPVDLITSLPYQFGFHPKRSVVLVCLMGDHVGLVERDDRAG
jgi:hypothetical protein